MNKVLNFGSLNIDNVYTVNHIVQGGETISSSKLEKYCGGKGLNQGIALAKAGADVCLAGTIGADGEMLLDACRQHGVNISLIRQLDVLGGHTVIQVDQNGQNCIILYGGTNQMQSREYIDEVLSHFSEGDYLVLQNEINLLDYIIDQAFERKMKIVLNPSPFDEKISECDLSKIWLFMLNEIEGEQFSGSADPDTILERLHKKYPASEIVLTLGSRGAVYYDGKQKHFQDIFKVQVIDTTAAGDTFTGFFLASVIEGKDAAQALRIASKASSIAVTRAGAVPSIPTREEVLKSLA